MGLRFWGTPARLFRSTSSRPTLFSHADHLNTARLVANSSGTAMWRWDQQEPFGVNVPDENPSGLGVFEQPLRFPGQYACAANQQVRDLNKMPRLH